MWIVGYLFLLYFFLVAPSGKRRNFQQKKYAHRGLYSKNQQIKENSFAAFQLAVAKGYGIELDVQLSKDEQVVIYHDDCLTRLEQDSHFVHEYTFEELKKYQLPLLTEVLKMVDGQVDLIVELKSVPVAQVAPFCEKVYAILQEYQGTYCIESFNPLIVAWFKRHAPQVMRGQLIQPVKEYPDFWQGVFLNSFLYQFLTRPHFIAFELTTTRWNPALWLNKICGARFALWTVQSLEQESRKVDAYIFEHYDADNRNN